MERKILRRLEELEKRVRRLERWRERWVRSAEEAENLMERYRELFSPSDEDIRKIKELMEKKRRELVT